MRRVALIASLVAALAIPAALYGQRGGGGRSFGSARMGGGGGGFHAAPSAPRPSVAAPAMRSAPYRAPAFRRPAPIGGVYGHRPYGPGRLSYNRPGVWSYFSYPLYPYYGYGYPNGDSSSAADTQAASAAPADDPLVGQVQALTDEVDEMRAEQAANERDLAFAAPPAIPEPKPASTILVFRDGHQMEVQNYAVMGATVWVLGDQTTRKVALAELDMDVTRKLNADRGVEFTGSASR